MPRLCANAGPLDRDLWRGGREPGAKSAGARRCVRGGRNRHQDPAKDQGWDILQVFPGQVAFHGDAQQRTGWGGGERVGPVDGGGLGGVGNTGTVVEKGAYKRLGCGFSGCSRPIIFGTLSCLSPVLSTAI